MNRWLAVAVALVLVGGGGVLVGLSINGSSDSEVTPTATNEAADPATPLPTVEETGEADTVEAFFDLPPASVADKFLLNDDEVQLPTGTSDSVEVVAQAPYDQQSQILPIVIRNTPPLPMSVKPSIPWSSRSRAKVERP